MVADSPPCLRREGGLGQKQHGLPYAMIGGLTHDLKYEGGDPGLLIGDDNVFREYVTAHVARMRTTRP